MRLRLFSLILLFATSCASNSYLNSPGHGAFDRGDYEVAGELYEKEIPKTDKNKLLFQLDAGMAFYNAGKFDRAIPHFLEAVKFWESKDFVSISEQIAKYAVSENIKTYIGEDYERVLIHVFLALSYAGTGKTEDAQVEARRVDLLLKQMREQEKKNYTESAFARWLSALLWESTGNWDSARIDYEAAYGIDANFPGIRQDILRACVASGYGDRYTYWKKKWPGEVSVTKVDKKKSELVVFVSYGMSPIKVPNGGDRTALPLLYPRPWAGGSEEIELGPKKVTQSQVVLDLEDLTRKFFDEKLKWLAARKLITLGAKAGVAYAVSRVTKSNELGVLAFLAMAAMDTADLRGWNTLPAGIKVLRVPIEPGTDNLKITIKGPSGAVMKTLDLGPRNFLAGQKVFVVIREG